ncbi:hypothetical protein RHSIM_Rhsim11G0047600 [Rhododendron simsii]|uniref:Uncharacterized protein n=1 Tax=Rhododendron simsii TaxID=118357 RepID=A0A834GA67_RHOSS|nr:hypothetical protein RHSIM_Rhsim11G0047600 [Rhododendron simsii]
MGLMEKMRIFQDERKHLDQILAKGRLGKKCLILCLREPTSLIVLACAAVSLGLEIKQHGLKEGCYLNPNMYNGGSIFVAFFVVTTILVVIKFRQNRQFVKLSKVSNNIQAEIVRKGGETLPSSLPLLTKVSCFEIIVGDVVCLKSGDQGPADELFTNEYSLLVEIAETDPVEVDLSHNHNPFLFFGTKVKVHLFAYSILISFLF